MERQDMTTGTETCRIAVIGAGPRALGALEALIRRDRAGGVDEPVRQRGTATRRQHQRTADHQPHETTLTLS